MAARLRARRQPVSTADLIAARTMAGGLARLRGHAHPARVDVLDGLVSALVGDALDQPLPWASRGRLAAGTHPAVVEMVAALSGDRVGRLHPDTPLPPLVHDVDAELDRHRIGPGDAPELDLTVPPTWRAAACCTGCGCSTCPGTGATAVRGWVPTPCSPSAGHRPRRRTGWPG